MDVISLFAREILLTLGYEGHDVLLQSRYYIPLLICNTERSVKTDVSLIRPSSTTVLLVVQQDKTPLTSGQRRKLSLMPSRLFSGIIVPEHDWANLSLTL